jgi:hypothetical protein
VAGVIVDSQIQPTPGANIPLPGRKTHRRFFDFPEVWLSRGVIVDNYIQPAPGTDIPLPGVKPYGRFFDFREVWLSRGVKVAMHSQPQPGAPLNPRRAYAPGLRQGYGRQAGLPTRSLK